MWSSQQAVRSSKHLIIALFSAVLVLVALLSAGFALAGATPAFASTKAETVTLPLNADSDQIKTIRTKWSLDWFKDSATSGKENADLAIASVVLSGDAEAGDSKIIAKTDPKPKSLSKKQRSKLAAAIGGLEKNDKD